MHRQNPFFPTCRLENSNTGVTFLSLIIYSLNCLCNANEIAIKNVLGTRFVLSKEFDSMKVFEEIPGTVESDFIFLVLGKSAKYFPDLFCVFSERILKKDVWGLLGILGGLVCYLGFIVQGLLEDKF